MDVSSMESDNDKLEAFWYKVQPKLIIIIKLDIGSDVCGIPLRVICPNLISVKYSKFT